MKRFIAICAMALVMTSCVSPSATATPRTSAVVQQSHTVTKTLMDTIVQTHNDLVHTIILQKNTKKINTVINNLEKHVGKTWYVFSGASPMGWDCSGMTMWAYSLVGIPLEHRASIQQHSGMAVKTPKRGDLVLFTYKGSKSAYHVGIYISPDKMIHAGKKGEATSIVSISKFAGKYSTITYRRLIQSL